MMRMQVAALRVVMADGYPAAESNIDRHILHRLGVERRLELGRHETIPVAGVDQTDKVNGEHGHVECDGDDDQTEGTRKEVFEPEALCITVLATNRSKDGYDLPA